MSHSMRTKAKSVSGKLFSFIVISAGILFTAGGALADQPYPWQKGMQEPVTPIAHAIFTFHNELLILSFSIVALVMALMLVVIVRFNAKANPVPSKTAHNTLIEVIWTIIPVIILVIIAVPSIRLVYLEDVVVDGDITIKATGHQWYWTYNYPDEAIEFDALLDEEGLPRLLATDNHVVVPVNTKVRMLITASPEDVIHSWAMPAFGIKTDAVPGRLNETWFTVEREGTYYGQCSELCGINHGFMPITVEVVSKEKYEAWLVRARQEFADNSGAGSPVAGR